jgi:hypothetical protein
LNKTITQYTRILFLISLVLLLIFYSKGYDTSLDWEVVSTGQIETFEALEVNEGLMSHSVEGEKIVLQENYKGSEIRANTDLVNVLLVFSWIGICMTLAGASYLNRFSFFIAIGLLALFTNRLNLFEIGLFGITGKMVLLIPFIGLAVPLIYFNEYRKNISLGIRFLSLLIISTVIFWFGVENKPLFAQHYLAHATFSYALCGILFLFIIAEEAVMLILIGITNAKNARGNHIHFTILSLVYIGNLTLYYLNKTGYWPNAFHLFDPYVALAISSIIGFYSGNIM